MKSLQCPYGGSTIIKVGEKMARSFETYKNEYLALVQAVTFNFGAQGKGVSKIKYYVNLIG